MDLTNLNEAEVRHLTNLIDTNERLETIIELLQVMIAQSKDVLMTDADAAIVKENIILQNQILKEQLLHMQETVGTIQ